MRTIALLLALGLSVAYGQNVCTTIDPAGCRPHVDEHPFEGDEKTQLHIAPQGAMVFKAQAVLVDSCTWCGKVAK